MPLWCFFTLLLLLSVTSHPVVWVGGVTSTQASFRALGFFNQTFLLSLNEDLSDPGYSQLLTSNLASLTVHLTCICTDYQVNSLQPATTYYYGFEDEEKGRFQTFATGRCSFKVGFGSCAATASDAQVWHDLQKENLHLFVHMGDMHYNNIVENNVTKYTDSFHEVFDGESQRNFYHTVPLAYIWDDHDYGDNNADATSPSRLAALQGYTQNFPHYPLSGFAGGKGNIGQAFTVGAVRFLMPDLRSEAYSFQPGSKTSPGQIMSQRQMDWLLEELSKFENYSLVVIVSSRHWIGKAEPGEEPWYAFPEDRLKLANHIANNNITNVLMIAGSTHMLAFDDGSNSDYSDNGGAGIPVMQAAPLDRWGSTKGGDFTHGCYSRRGDYNEQYGILEIKDDPTSNVTCVRISGYRVNEGRLIDWEKCTPLVKVGKPGKGSCNIDIMPPWAWVAYCVGCGTILLLFVLCMIGYFTYITSPTKKRRTLFISCFFLASMIVLIALFPILRVVESNFPHRPSYLPVHSAYVLMAVATVYTVIVSYYWDNKHQTATPQKTENKNKRTDSDVVELSDFEDENPDVNSD